MADKRLLLTSSLLYFYYLCRVVWAGYRVLKGPGFSGRLVAANSFAAMRGCSVP